MGELALGGLIDQNGHTRVGQYYTQRPLLLLTEPLQYLRKFSKRRGEFFAQADALIPPLKPVELSAMCKKTMSEHVLNSIPGIVSQLGDLRFGQNTYKYNKNYKFWERLKDMVENARNV